MGGLAKRWRTRLRERDGRCWGCGMLLYRQTVGMGPIMVRMGLFIIRTRDANISLGSIRDEGFVVTSNDGTFILCIGADLL